MFNIWHTRTSFRVLSPWEVLLQCTYLFSLVGVFGDIRPFHTSPLRQLFVRLHYVGCDISSNITSTHTHLHLLTPTSLHLLTSTYIYYWLGLASTNNKNNTGWLTMLMMERMRRAHVGMTCNAVCNWIDVLSRLASTLQPAAVCI